MTLTGWFTLLLGLIRTFAPGLYDRGVRDHGSTLVGFEAALLGLGIFLIYQDYARATGVMLPPE